VDEKEQEKQLGERTTHCSIRKEGKVKWVRIGIRK
jgi:hypothetical protein